MAYKYDVFLSYNRRFPHGKWVKDVFLPLFEAYLCEALNEEVKIFIDTEEIMSGQAWKLKIQNALIHSKIMVSILSPAYFRSEWCKKEFAVMDYRQRQCGYLTLENPNGLIVPVKIFDGHHFPEYLTSILQTRDFNRFSRVGIQAAPTPLYIEFQEELLAWVNEVAHAYHNAPDWDESWRHPDVVTDSWADLDKLNGITSKNPPTL